MSFKVWMQGAVHDFENSEFVICFRGNGSLTSALCMSSFYLYWILHFK